MPPPPGTTNQEMELIITDDCEDPVERPVCSVCLTCSQLSFQDLGSLPTQVPFLIQRLLLRKSISINLGIPPN